MMVRVRATAPCSPPQSVGMAEISEYIDRVSDQYGAVSGQYDRVKNLPYAMVERETLCAGLPDLTGRRILDIGCGSGYYSRLFKRLGAETVVGVDIVPEMIDLARRIESAAPQGI